MSLVIREATPDDAEPLIAHVTRVVAEPDGKLALMPGEFNVTIEQERKILADFAASDNSIFLVAEMDGQIIGALNCKGGNRLAMRHVATLGMSIDQPWRNQGIGGRLMARAIGWAKGTGAVTRIELHVLVDNLPAIHLYEKFGCVIEGRRRNALCRNGVYCDDFVMGLLI